MGQRPIRYYFKTLGFDFNYYNDASCTKPTACQKTQMQLMLYLERREVPKLLTDVTRTDFVQFTQ